MEKLKGFVIIINSFIIISLLFSCQYRDRSNIKESKNKITFKVENDVVKILEEDFSLKKEKTQFMIKIINQNKWEKIKLMKNPQIIISFQDSSDIIAYPLSVFNSSSNKNYFYPVDKNGIIFYDKTKTINITKNN